VWTLRGGKGNFFHLLSALRYSDAIGDGISNF
jgi:hypothetical protein